MFEIIILLLLHLQLRLLPRRETGVLVHLLGRLRLGRRRSDLFFRLRLRLGFRLGFRRLLLERDRLLVRRHPTRVFLRGNERAERAVVLHLEPPRRVPARVPEQHRRTLDVEQKHPAHVPAQRV